jgi:AcrR family transcriptional regulator
MGKGEETRERIVSRAMALASRDGFEGLSIGALAADMKLSKSGLFAHFGSKEELQLSVIQHAREVFSDRVIKPALQQPRGETRLRALFENWLAWTGDRNLLGGCVLIAAAHEFDDQPGPQRDFVEKSQRDLLDCLQRCAKTAVEAGDFRTDLDTQQFGHDLYALVVGYHQVARLFRERKSNERLRASFERLLDWARRRH